MKIKFYIIETMVSEGKQSSFPDQIIIGQRFIEFNMDRNKSALRGNKNLILRMVFDSGKINAKSR
ncbi:hypothetical protein, partial [Caldisericum sp.]|uniref:hypothetical protein n=1 Tax=Caldisericum sp. TaxID=2499687 RepID=UPI003D0EECE8